MQNPLLLPSASEPQPDIAVLKGQSSLYRRRRPSAQDVLLLVEVSDTTLAADRQVKLPLYVRAGIPEVWIVNIDASTIEVYSQPSGGKYTSTLIASPGETLPLPSGLPGNIPVAEVLA